MRCYLPPLKKCGCAVLSGNVRDFDLLQELGPGKVIFYQMVT